MKEIQLTQGKVALVDDEDYEYLNQWKWQANQKGNKRFYASRYKMIEGKYSVIYLHRFILKISDKNIFIDHANMNTLDNRKSNLRICNRSQNTCNTEKNTYNLCGYKGVSFDKRCNKYFAVIKFNQKRYYLGYYIDPKDAAKAYNDGAIKYHGEFAKLNKID
jgi:L-fucose mutarotase/ribose pyranase (RbsD/FucU family)